RRKRSTCRPGRSPGHLPRFPKDMAGTGGTFCHKQPVQHAADGHLQIASYHQELVLEGQATKDGGGCQSAEAISMPVFRPADRGILPLRAANDREKYQTFWCRQMEWE